MSKVIVINDTSRKLATGELTWDKLSGQTQLQLVGDYSKALTNGSITHEQIPSAIRPYVNKNVKQQVQHNYNVEQQEKERYNSSSTGRFTNAMGNVVSSTMALPLLDVVGSTMIADGAQEATAQQSVEALNTLNQSTGQRAIRYAGNLAGSLLGGEAANQASKTFTGKSIGANVNQYFLKPVFKKPLERLYPNFNWNDQLATDIGEFINPGYALSPIKVSSAVGQSANTINLPLLEGVKEWATRNISPIYNKVNRWVTKTNPWTASKRADELTEKLYNLQSKHITQEQFNDNIQRRLDNFYSEVRKNESRLKRTQDDFWDELNDVVNKTQKDANDKYWALYNLPYQHEPKILRNISDEWKEVDILRNRDPKFVSKRLGVPVKKTPKGYDIPVSSAYDLEFATEFINPATGEKMTISPTTFGHSIYQYTTGEPTLKRITLPNRLSEGLSAEQRNILAKINQETMERLDPMATGQIKPFGSMTSASEGYLPHFANDTDYIVTQEFFDNHINGKYFENHAKPAKYGPKIHFEPELKGNGIDINIIHQDENGKATGNLAWEMFRKVDPEGYWASKQREIAEGISEIPYTPKDLLGMYDPLKATILDSFIANENKPKHFARSLYYLQTLPTDMLKEILSTKGKMFFGSGYRPITNNIDLTNINANLRFLDQLGIPALDKERLARNPERMRLILEHWYQSVSGYGRAANISLPEVWLSHINPQMNPAAKGVASGVGINGVRMGNSREFGNSGYYGIIQADLNKFIAGKNPEEILNYYNSLDMHTGKVPTLDEISKLLTEYARRDNIPINTVIKDNSSMDDVAKSIYENASAENYREWFNLMGEYLPFISNKRSSYGHFMGVYSPVRSTRPAIFKMTPENQKIFDELANTRKFAELKSTPSTELSAINDYRYILKPSPLERRKINYNLRTQGKRWFELPDMYKKYVDRRIAKALGIEYDGSFRLLNEIDRYLEQISRQKTLAKFGLPTFYRELDNSVAKELTRKQQGLPLFTNLIEALKKEQISKYGKPTKAVQKAYEKSFGYKKQLDDLKYRINDLTKKSAIGAGTIGSIGALAYFLRNMRKKDNEDIIQAYNQALSDFKNGKISEDEFKRLKIDLYSKLR